MKSIATLVKTFVKNLIGEINKGDLMSVANDLTYKVFFSLFPFVIFLMSIVGFLDLDESYLLSQIYALLPETIQPLFRTFINEVVRIRSANILSFSLILSVWSASWGFGTVKKSINKVYGLRDERSIVTKILINMASVVAFTLMIIISFVLLVFGDNITSLIRRYLTISAPLLMLIQFSRYIITVIMMLFAVLIINKLSVSNKAKWKTFLPGSFTTVFLWMLIGKVFNMYVNNFSSYSTVYGSLAGIIIFLLWLNILCITLLLGCAINAVCSQFYFVKISKPRNNK